MSIVVKHLLQHANGRLSYRRIYPAAYRPFLTIPDGESRTQLKVSLGFKADPDFFGLYQRAHSTYESRVEMARRLKEGAYDKLDDKLLAYLGRRFEVEWLQHDDKKRRSGQDGWGRSDRSRLGRMAARVPLVVR